VIPRPFGVKSANLRILSNAEMQLTELGYADYVFAFREIVMDSA
jgi:hypothetical protein